MENTNILKLIYNIANRDSLKIKKHDTSEISINRVGDSLEYFIKEAFANSFNIENKLEKLKLYSKLFSYQGNQNNPPDLILKNSDAIEVKKLGGYGAIALNSSYPKDKIYFNDKMLTKECQNIDGGNWQKELFYVIGTLKKEILKNLFIIQGSCYCAEKEIYEKIKLTIKNGVESINGVEFSETQELGKIKKVDPLGITDLRVRGMYSIENPFKVFSYIKEIEKPKDNKSFIYAIFLKEKFDKFSKIDIENILKLENSSFFDIDILSPNNPSKFLKVKLIKVEI